MAKDANKKHYFSVLADHAKIEKLMSQILKDETDVTLWKQGQRPEEAENFQPIKFVNESRELHIKAKGIIAKLKTSPLVSEETVLFKGMVDKTYYFTTGKLAYDKATAIYTFTINGDIFISQQRSNYRLKAGKNTAIQFKIDDEVFSCEDVSAGGTSFITTMENAERFSKGAIFEACTLRLNRDQFKIPHAKIAGNWPIKDEEENITAIGIGIQFTNISSKLDEDLCKSINSEARAEEIRKTLLHEKINKGN